jgi:hypothetical protein
MNFGNSNTTTFDVAAAIRKHTPCTTTFTRNVIAKLDNDLRHAANEIFKAETFDDAKKNFISFCEAKPGSNVYCFTKVRVDLLNTDEFKFDDKYIQPALLEILEDKGISERNKEWIEFSDVLLHSMIDSISEQSDMLIVDLNNTEIVDDNIDSCLASITNDNASIANETETYMDVLSPTVITSPTNTSTHGSAYFDSDVVLEKQKNVVTFASPLVSSRNNDATTQISSKSAKEKVNTDVDPVNKQQLIAVSIPPTTSPNLPIHIANDFTNASSGTGSKDGRRQRITASP